MKSINGGAGSGGSSIERGVDGGRRSEIIVKNIAGKQSSLFDIEGV